VKNPAERGFMKKAMTAAAVLILSAAPTFAVTNPQRSIAPGANFAERKAQTLAPIDERIAGDQEETTAFRQAKTTGRSRPAGTGSRPDSRRNVNTSGNSISSQPN